MSDAAPAQPRPAATIALVRDHEHHLEVFLVRRHARSGFMANAYVFPGGRLEESDRSPALQSRLAGDYKAQVALMEDVEDERAACAHLVAALRETYEESGVLLATRSSGEACVPEVDWQHALNSGERSFASLVCEEGLWLNASSLAYFAHWVTPVFESRRYAARFFLALAPTDQEGRHDGHETTDSIWIQPSEALEEHRRGALSLAPPQWQVLHDLASHADTRSLMAWARGLERVAPTQPHRFALDGTLALALPGDPEHPSSQGTQGTRRRIVLRDGTWHSA